MATIDPRRLRWWVAGVLCLSLFLGFSVLGAGSAVAAVEDNTNPTITLSPTREKLALDPGEVYEGTFEIFNSGSSGLDYTAYVSPYQISDIDYQNPDFDTEAPRTQLSRWVTVLQSEGTLAVDEIVEVPYRIEVPNDVPAGGQYAAIFVETALPDSDGSSVVAKSRAGILLYVTVNGDTREEGLITESAIKWWQPEAPLMGSTIVQNSGNTDFFVSTTFHVANVFGAEAFDVSRQSPVLPDTSRRITMEWPDSVPGIYQVTTTTSFLGTETTQTQWVVVLPVPLVIGIMIGLLLVSAVLFLLSRSRRNRFTKRVDAAVAEALTEGHRKGGNSEISDA
ncbi:MAG: hypothetical protein E2601_06495 [Microbacterium sp.]|nr:hypothetical protein [Microbacterium sp.]